MSEIDDFEQIRIESDGEMLVGWMKTNIKAQESPLIIFFGGNAQCSSNTCAAFLDNDIYSYFEGYNFLMVDYPGYGLSDGTPSDKSMFDAALAVYDFAIELECVDKNRVVALGYSIGTGVATYLASQRDVDGLILLAPYDCALSLYNDTLYIFHGPLELLARYEFDSKEYAKSVSTRPLIIATKDDEIINYEFSVNLSTYFQLQPEVVLLDGFGHNDMFAQKEVLDEIRGYIEERI